jgi:hypothetical protein
VRLVLDSWCVIRKSWCVHNRLFNTNCEEKFKWTPDILIHMYIIIIDFKCHFYLQVHFIFCNCATLFFIYSELVDIWSDLSQKQWNNKTKSRPNDISLPTFEKQNGTRQLNNILFRISGCLANEIKIAIKHAKHQQHDKNTTLIEDKNCFPGVTPGDGAAAGPH